jgi:putative ABC transport system permease protein
MLVISWDAILGSHQSGFTRYLLTTADVGTAVRELERAGEPTGLVYSADEANDALPFLVVAWTFDFFALLGAVLAAVAAAALLVAIEARRRATAVAHALLARMGLRVRSLYLSYLAELAGLAVAAAAVGLLGGWLVLDVASARLDPVPWLRPIPVPASLLPLTAMVAATAALAVLVVAAVAARAAVRAPVRELLRGGAA